MDSSKKFQSSSIRQSVRGSNVVQGELKISKPSSPLTQRTSNRESVRENFNKIIVVCDLSFSFGEHPGPSFIKYIWNTYSPIVEDFFMKYDKKRYFSILRKILPIIRTYFEMMDCRVAITLDMERSRDVLII
ncbi:hypothetical protein H5410_021891 [Solanum commersonii]|uniref:Uncharacterized protein n=1 Tax=Solanum commersonii TaxID=4109 RepID=A0A9J5ZD91_SOLCO|nr:hypothetical protein H5410_021891 [Solanum commersonii]